VSAFDFYRYASSTEALTQAFADELAKLEPSVEVEPITASAVVGLAIKCAEVLETDGQDAASADAVIEFINAEMLANDQVG